MNIHPTATLRHLARKHRLSSLRFPRSGTSETVGSQLKTLLDAPGGLPEAAFEKSLLEELERHFLVTRNAEPPPRPGLPFAFVQAINFELTYGCNLACRHCLQDGLRPRGTIPWIDEAVVATALEDGHWLGLVDTGVNFTGGEIYLPGSPVLRLIDKAASLGIPIRSNTNAWWGGRKNIKVGAATFDSDRHLVEHLREAGLSMLALSVDGRYEQYPDLFERVLRVAALCEASGLVYQFVATDACPSLMAKGYEMLVERIGDQPKYCSLQPMTTVDIGAAAGFDGDELRPETLADLTLDSPCERRGFHRPFFLHVNPGGGVRSCLYAPGAGVLGNLAEERLPQVLNRADRNPVVRLFAEGSLDDFVERSITPWKHLYRDLEHPCSASALIARVAGALHQTRNHLGRDLEGPEWEEMHRTIARDLNLTAESLPSAATVL